MILAHLGIVVAGVGPYHVESHLMMNTFGLYFVNSHLMTDLFGCFLEKVGAEIVCLMLSWDCIAVMVIQLA